MIQILTALRNDHPFTLQPHHTREELLQLRTDSQFNCPSCKAPVTLKIGTLKIPHFAHLQKICCTPGSEPETQLHLLGKFRLSAFFRQQKIPVHVEHYLPPIKQRPDLLTEKAVIEFQCSPLPVEEITKRSKGYAELALDAIWIRGTQKTPPPGPSIFQIRPFERAMFRGRQEHPHLLHFNPENSLFIYYSNLFYLQGNRWAGKVSLLPQHEQVYPFAAPKILNKEEYGRIAALMRIEKNKYVRSQLFAKNRMRNPFWRLSYELQLDREAIPDIFGLPLFGGHLLMEHPLLWQMKAALLIESGKPVDTLVKEKLVKTTRSDIESQTIQVLSAYEAIYRNAYSACLPEVVDISYHLLAKAWEN
ncbi:MAG: competence protein CoiA [Bacillota bacterium]